MKMTDTLIKLIMIFVAANGGIYMTSKIYHWRSCPLFYVAINILLVIGVLLKYLNLLQE